MSESVQPVNPASHGGIPLRMKGRACGPSPASPGAPGTARPTHFRGNRIRPRTALPFCTVWWVLFSMLGTPGAAMAAVEKPRVVVLTDIENEPDDAMSLVRLLTYANHFDLEGLVATTSIHQRNRVAPERIRRIVTAYAKVRDNLEQHEPGFPAGDRLLAVVSEGRAVYGREGVGEGQDSPGSGLWTDADDEVLGSDGRWHDDNHATIWRWRSACQNDFAARMDWTIKPYAEANHPPTPRLSHADRLTAKPGERVNLSAAGSTDPDGDALSYVWFYYHEAGTFPVSDSRSGQPVSIQNFDQPHAWFTVPTTRVMPPGTGTMHLILALTDHGTPRLTRYQRVVVHVTP